MHFPWLHSDIQRLFVPPGFIIWSMSELRVLEWMLVSLSILCLTQEVHQKYRILCLTPEVAHACLQCRPGLRSAFAYVNTLSFPSLAQFCFHDLPHTLQCSQPLLLLHGPDSAKVRMSHYLWSLPLILHSPPPVLLKSPTWEAILLFSFLSWFLFISPKMFFNLYFKVNESD